MKQNERESNTLSADCELILPHSMAGPKGLSELSLNENVHQLEIVEGF